METICHGKFAAWAQCAVTWEGLPTTNGGVGGFAGPVIAFQSLEVGKCVVGSVGVLPCCAARSLRCFSSAGLSCTVQDGRAGLAGFAMPWGWGAWNWLRWGWRGHGIGVSHTNVVQAGGDCGSIVLPSRSACSNFFVAVLYQHQTYPLQCF